jgi:hypothetical protein
MKNLELVSVAGHAAGLVYLKASANEIESGFVKLSQFVPLSAQVGFLPRPKDAVRHNLNSLGKLPWQH